MRGYPYRFTAERSTSHQLYAVSVYASDRDCPIRCTVMNVVFEYGVYSVRQKIRGEAELRNEIKCSSNIADTPMNRVRKWHFTKFVSSLRIATAK